MNAHPATAELAQVLAQISSSDNAARLAAENALNEKWLMERPEDFLRGIVALMRGHEDPNVWNMGWRKTFVELM